jgi:hypothetical protein
MKKKMELLQYLRLRHKYTITCLRDSRRGFGLDIRFTDHFNTEFIITINYSAIAGLHTLQITDTHRLVFSVCYSLHESFPGNGF